MKNSKIDASNWGLRAVELLAEHTYLHTCIIGFPYEMSPSQQVKVEFEDPKLAPKNFFPKYLRQFSHLYIKYCLDDKHPFQTLSLLRRETIRFYQETKKNLSDAEEVLRNKLQYPFNTSEADSSKEEINKVYAKVNLSLSQRISELEGIITMCLDNIEEAEDYGQLMISARELKKFSLFNSLRFSELEIKRNHLFSAV